MTKLKAIIQVELPDEVMDLLERLVTVLELEYDEKYGDGESYVNEDENED